MWNPSPLPSAKELQSWRWDELDILIVNQGEGVELIEALAGQKRSEDEDAEETMRSLASIPALAKSLTWIVMTRGAHGVLASVLLEGSSDERKLFSIPASKPERVVDTTGAGDTFAGYLVSTLAGQTAEGSSTRRPRNEDEVLQVLTRAKVAAAMAVETQGATESIPDASQVEARMKGEQK